MHFGNFLLDRQKITKDHLEDALQHQKFFPGRLGTQLVELEFISLSDLELVLSYFYEVPEANDQEMDHLDEFCKNLAPVEIVEKFQIIPIKKTSNSLHVAMVNPKNEKALKWLKKNSGCDLKIFSISEIRFSYYLFRHYNRELNQRIRNIYFGYLKQKCKKKLQNEGLVKKEKESTIPKSSFENDKKDLEKLGIKPLAENEFLSEGDYEQWLNMHIQHYGSVPSPPSNEPEIEFAKVPKL